MERSTAKPTGSRKRAAPGAAIGDPSRILAGEVIEIAYVAKRYDIYARDVARIAGLSPSASRPDRACSTAAQRRLREMVEILERALPMAGNPQAAMAWYKAQPLPGFGRTAEQLVKSGNAGAVRDYLDEVAVGGFA